MCFYFPSYKGPDFRNSNIKIEQYPKGLGSTVQVKIDLTGVKLVLPRPNSNGITRSGSSISRLLSQECCVVWSRSKYHVFILDAISFVENLLFPECNFV